MLASIEQKLQHLKKDALTNSARLVAHPSADSDKQVCSPCSNQVERNVGNDEFEDVDVDVDVDVNFDYVDPTSLVELTASSNNSNPPFVTTGNTRIDDIFYKKLCKLHKFIVKNGHCHVPRSEDQSLHNFCYGINHKYKMSKQRFEALKSIGFQFAPSSTHACHNNRTDGEDDSTASHTRDSVDSKDAFRGKGIASSGQGRIVKPKRKEEPPAKTFSPSTCSGDQIEKEFSSDNSSYESESSRDNKLRSSDEDSISSSDLSRRYPRKNHEKNLNKRPFYSSEDSEKDENRSSTYEGYDSSDDEGSLKPWMKHDLVARPKQGGAQRNPTTRTDVNNVLRRRSTRRRSSTIKVDTKKFTSSTRTLRKPERYGSHVDEDEMEKALTDPSNVLTWDYSNVESSPPTRSKQAAECSGSPDTDGDIQLSSNRPRKRKRLEPVDGSSSDGKSLQYSEQSEESGSDNDKRLRSKTVDSNSSAGKYSENSEEGSSEESKRQTLEEAVGSSSDEKSSGYSEKSEEDSSESFSNQSDSDYGPDAADLEF